MFTICLRKLCSVNET